MKICDAIKLTECLEVDYGSMGLETQEEIDEFDEALDLVFKAASDMSKQKGETR